MMKIIFAVASIAMTLPVFAGTSVINQRQDNQQNRIAQGVASGQLTANETLKLEKGQQRIATMKANAKADGLVTKGERAQIKQSLNVENQKIFKKKHN